MDDKNMEYALFKFRMIAPVLNDPSINQRQYFKKLDGKLITNLKIGEKKLNAGTLKKWLIKYRSGGFDALIGKGRSDKGQSRVISEELSAEIANLLNQYSFKTVKNLYDYLLRESHILPDDFCYNTLNNYVRGNNLFDPDSTKPRKAFEMDSINKLWIADFMYGPYVYQGKRKIRSYMFAIIDDYSRLIVGADFYDNQGTAALSNTLKKAVATYGIPNRFYCDNAKVFRGNYLEVIAARLGFQIVHSKIYDSAPRGKIERYNNTVHKRFEPFFKIDHQDKKRTLTALKSAYAKWIMNEYNNHLHSTTKETPMNRFLKCAEKVKLRKMPTHELDAIFHHSEIRTVNNDSTISFDTEFFEVPTCYIGKKIEIRYSPENRNELYLFEENKQVCKISKLDRVKNAKFSIHFSKSKE